MKPKKAKLRIWHVQARFEIDGNLQTVGYFPDRTAHCAIRQAMDLLEMLGDTARELVVDEVNSAKLEW